MENNNATTKSKEELYDWLEHQEFEIPTAVPEIDQNSEIIVVRVRNPIIP